MQKIISFKMDVFDAAERYRSEGNAVIVLAGKEYGSGSSRDWAAKGPWMQVECQHIVYKICSTCSIDFTFAVYLRLLRSHN